MQTGRYFIGAVIVLGVLGLITVPSSLAGKNDSKDIQAKFSGHRAFGQVAALADFGPRPGGGPREALAAAYLKAQLQSLRLNVEVQSFPVGYF